MRVLHFVAEGRACGPLVRIKRIQEAFLKSNGQGIEQIVACPTIQPPDFLNLPGLTHWEYVPSKPSFEKPISSGLKWIATRVWPDINGIRQIIREVQPSVVHVNGAILAAGAIAARLENRPLIWHLNDMTVPKFYARLVRRISKLCNAKLIVASQAVNGYYGLPTSTPVFYPPAPPSLPEAKRERGSSIHIGHLANVRPGKGLEVLIASLGLLKDRMPNFVLEIGGEILQNKRFYFEAVQRQIADLGIASQVKFLGFIREPLAWLRGLDLLAFPSFREAAPVAVIEAMACGVPVVGSDIPAVVEILGGCGVLVKPNDPLALSDALEGMLRDERQRLRLGQEGMSRVREAFDAEMISQKYSRLYRSLLTDSAAQEHDIS